MSDNWILSRDRLPEVGEDVILYFKDTVHTHPSWPKIDVKPAWRCNVGEKNSPDGDWAIEGRLGNFVIPLQDGIAWMPLPALPLTLLNDGE